MIDSLETRRLFSDSLPVGMLPIIGTDHPDVIQVIAGTKNGEPVIRVVNNGESRAFNLKSVRQIAIATGAGGDFVRFVGVDIPSTIDSGKGDDTIFCGGGDDTIKGSGGADSLNGGGGFDVLAGGLGIDTVKGNAGDDRIVLDGSGDVVSGGDGNDVMDYTESASKAVDFIGSTDPKQKSSDQIAGDVESIFGSKFGDQFTNTKKQPLSIYGRDGDDSLTGGGGDDLLEGEQGNDTLSGGDGNDTLDGGAGRDSLSGGAGEDHFKSKDGQIDRLDGGAGFDVLDAVDTLIVSDIRAHI
jgi:Ca2+-binding RTX toxin-like protein